jgi:hypothetical protein
LYVFLGFADSSAAHISVADSPLLLLLLLPTVDGTG